MEGGGGRNLGGWGRRLRGSRVRESGFCWVHVLLWLIIIFCTKEERRFRVQVWTFRLQKPPSPIATPIPIKPSPTSTPRNVPPAVLAVADDPEVVLEELVLVVLDVLAVAFVAVDDDVGLVPGQYSVAVDLK